MVNSLTILVSTIFNSQVFLLKNVSSFCKCKSYSHFFSKNISIYAIFDDKKFNDTLTNNIASFEQLGPLVFKVNEPGHSIFYKIACELSKDSDQQLHSLISVCYPPLLQFLAK